MEQELSICTHFYHEPDLGILLAASPRISALRMTCICLILSWSF